MKRLIYQVYVGKKSALYDHCTTSVKEYCKRHGIDYVVQTTPILFIRPDPFMTGRSKEATDRLGYLPIFEKENAFTYLKTYDQVAIIDSDIYIRPDAPNIFDGIRDDVDFAGVVEREMPITGQYANKIANYSKMQYSSIRNVDWKWNDLGGEFINMGVMVMNKSLLKYLNNETPKQFLSRPRFKPFVDGQGNWKWSTDQTLLNTWIKEEKMNVQHLDWRFNGLFTANTKIQECYFVHFFLKDKLPDRGENVKQLMDNISEKTSHE
jgi:hypothetical protein